MFFNLLSTCVSASLCCLAIFCAVKARQHNTPPDATDAVRNGFNSDAAANSLRALKPMELQDPMVAFSIFASVTVTRAGMFTSLSEGLEFVSRLLKGFMIGFAIATGVSLLILPITSRGNVFQDMRQYVVAVEGVLDAQIAFDEGITMSGIFGRGSLTRTLTTMSRRNVDGGSPESETDLQVKIKDLQGAMTKLNSMHSTVHADLFYSRDEIAWGKLPAEDLSDIASLFRSLLLPLSGMSMLPEILESIAKNEGQRDGNDDPGELETRQEEVSRVMETHHARLIEAADLVRCGLTHFVFTMELISAKHLKRWKKARLVGHAHDEEARGQSLIPGDEGFTLCFENQLCAYHERRKLFPRALTSLEAFSEKHEGVGDGDGTGEAADPHVRREFFLILYMEHLQDDLLNAILKLVKLAGSKVDNGTMTRGRLIFPRERSIRQWLSLSHSRSGQTSSESRQSSLNPANIHHTDLQTRYPDPEHLPPANIWEKGSAVLRKIAHALKSDQSTFGFRVAAASFSVGILAYLHQTQDFFIRQRCIWAMIVIVIGMNPTSGQTMFGFVARILATVVSLVLSLIVWYIVDGKTAGVIVFLYLANVFEYYFYVKVPQYFGASVISIVTLNVIIGYELQVRQLGIQQAESNGQPYYPIYLFGPYKLAAVAAGCAISFFWVIFPYPITAKSQVRRLLGQSMFVLARFYSCMHTTIEYWLSDELGNSEDTGSPGYELQAARHKIFKEEMMLLNSLRMHSHFSTFEPPIGGKFPKKTYDDIISEVQCILTSMSLMAHTTQGLETGSVDGNNYQKTDPWRARLADIALKSADFNSHSITSLLCLLSAAIMNSQPLPPYLSTPDSFPLARQMQKVDNELLSIRHIGDPSFSAFIALEVLRSVVSFSLQDLVE
ncbi:uncharacterized protein N7469_011611 [Penicillium citrinum]|uniref:ER transporter 6TM N-terminal domain-containing protein n=1 Tax=Penicillium citrinum TaxID=5077 RepID=A0A9W9NBD8_PENCI|nr:uncharacterized protein N7469_011611 [Penicillium citrinum]KAJ5216746.1 hypothetical protein N7469_011611 [Penicillium citrinum]